MIIKKVPYIYFLLYFQKNIIEVKILLNFGNEINIITAVYISKLGLQIYFTNIRAHKIDGSTFETSRMILARF